MQGNSTDTASLEGVLASLALGVSDAQLAQLRAYLALLHEANTRFNLTRIVDPQEAELRLLADSVALAPHLPHNTHRLLDLGSGGGVPGIPLAIVRPDIHILLVDATGKKVRFLQEVSEQIGLTNVSTIQARAEELARDRRHREVYDALTARAVARLVTLAELALPFLRVGGRAILPKGSGADGELSEAGYAIRMCGGRAAPIADSPIAGTRIIVIDKIRATPAQFPRRTGVPNSSPLYGPRS